MKIRWPRAARRRVEANGQPRSYRYGWCNSTFGACFERNRMLRLSTPTENAIAK
jgi:hypothetical protein